MRAQAQFLNRVSIFHLNTDTDTSLKQIIISILFKYVISATMQLSIRGDKAAAQLLRAAQLWRSKHLGHIRFCSDPKP